LPIIPVAVSSSVDFCGIDTGRSSLTLYSPTYSCGGCLIMVKRKEKEQGNGQLLGDKERQEFL
jgi:hypothetical protein